MTNQNPKVYLVGAGPGDKDLITVKGKELLESADVVIFDRLVSDGVLEYINPKAEKIFVGKSSTYKSIKQEEINEVIKKAVLDNPDKTVVRLKGGDPFIFGRGGEEALFLAHSNIAFEIVPGITSLSGAASVLFTPLTDRRNSKGIIILTGHSQLGKGLPDYDWPSLVKNNFTLAFYMAHKNLKNITEHLIGSGMDKTTPAIALMNATTKGEDFVESTVEDIYEKVSAKKLTPPIMLIIGGVVELGSELRGLLKDL